MESNVEKMKDETPDSITESCKKLFQNSSSTSSSGSFSEIIATPFQSQDPLSIAVRAVVRDELHDKNVKWTWDQIFEVSKVSDSAFRKITGIVDIGKTCENLLKLTDLDLKCKDISDIEPLEHLIGLKTLNISGNIITSIFPIESLTELTELRIGSNEVSDLGPLRQLEKLEILDAKNIGNFDLRPLQALIKLSDLDVGCNEIVFLDPLRNLRYLNTLRLDNNKISDLKPLESAFALKTLSLENNNISDLSPLQALTGLETLILNKNKISELISLKKLTGLKALEADDNHISDLTPLNAWKKLQKLSISRNSVSDLNGLQGLAWCLDTLNLKENEICDLDPLHKLNQLKELELSNNKICSLSPLRTLASIKRLHLSSNKISDLTPLSELTWLEILSLGNNNISDLSPLKELTKIETLNLQNNKLSDGALDSIQNLKGLRRLNLDQNDIVSDLAAVKWVDSLVTGDQRNFLHVLNQLAEDNVPLKTQLEKLAKMVSDLTELKLFYTFASIAFKSGDIDNRERKNIVKYALFRFAKIFPFGGKTARSIAVFKLVLEKAEADKLISRIDFHDLDRLAEREDTVNSPKIKTIFQTLAEHTARLDRLDKYVDSLNENIKRVNKSLEDFRDTCKADKKSKKRSLLFVACTTVLAMGIGAVGAGIVVEVIEGSMDVLVDLTDQSQLAALLPETGKLTKTVGKHLNKQSLKAMDKCYDQMSKKQKQEVNTDLKIAQIKEMASILNQPMAVEVNASGQDHIDDVSTEEDCASITAIVNNIVVGKIEKNQGLLLITAALKDYDAAMNEKNEFGKTAMQIAVEAGRNDLVQFLLSQSPKKTETSDKMNFPGRKNYPKVENSVEKPVLEGKVKPRGSQYSRKNSLLAISAAILLAIISTYIRRKFKLNTVINGKR